MRKAIIIILMGLFLAPSVLADTKADKYIAKGNKHLPYMVDDITQLNKLVKIDENTVELVHILINHNFNQINIEHFINAMPSVLHTNACNDGIVKRAFKRDISAVYTYFSKDGSKLASFDVTKQFCE